MKCKTVQRLRFEFSDSSLQKWQTDEINLHLKDCPNCHSIYQTELNLTLSIKTLDHLHSESAPITRLNALFEGSTQHQNIKKSNFPVSPVYQTFLSPKPLILFCCLLILILGSTLFLKSPQTPTLTKFQKFALLNNNNEGDALDAWRNKTLVISVYNEEGELVDQTSSSQTTIHHTNSPGGDTHEKDFYYL